jgi:site-specific DNA recombinase
MLRAAGYTRVSMGEQVKGHSLDAQTDHIKRYTAAQEWRLVKVYTDAGISAKQGTTRPGFEQLLQDARAGQFDVVIVDKIDRRRRRRATLAACSPHSINSTKPTSLLSPSKNTSTLPPLGAN